MVAAKRYISVAAMALVCAALLGCSNDAPTRDTVTKQEIDQRGLGDDALGTDGSTLGDVFRNERADDVSGGNLRVNKYLWRGSLDTLSFLPLLSTDPFSGVITTDWGTTEAGPGERFKVTVFVSDEKLTAESLKVAVFREVQGRNGWASAPVQPDTPRKIEDAILVRARQLRIQAKEAASG